MREGGRAGHSILAVSQVFPPDPTSLGQHLADATAELARRGHRVTLLTSNRGYDDPTVTFAAREVMHGVDVRRLPLSSFGKRTMRVRLLGGISFLLQATLRGLFRRNVDIVLVSTSPPMAGLAGVILAAVHRARMVYWVMDVNPDQAITLGLASPSGIGARLYEAMNRLVLGRADAVVAMDRFMAQRLVAKKDMSERLSVIAPWPHEDQPSPGSRDDNPFRRAHGLGDRFVVMYSGNHTKVNPLETVVAAARALEHEPDIVFVFVGKGDAKHQVDDARLSNVVSLPYEPLERLNDSLSAADLHVVTMGDDMVGIVHSCKAYGAFAAARPVLYVGPEHSSIADYVTENGAGWRVSHGDVAGAVAAIREAASMPRERLSAMGERAHALVQQRLSKEKLCGEFCDVVTGEAASAGG